MMARLQAALVATLFALASGAAAAAATHVFQRPPSSFAQPAVEKEVVLHTFTGTPDGAQPAGGVTIDAKGALYGVTALGGADGDGEVYKLTPSASGFTFSMLYSFTGGADGASPLGPPVVDKYGDLYGVTSGGGASSGPCGTLWKLTANKSGYVEQTLFALNCTTAGSPSSAVIREPVTGALYGMAQTGCAYGLGCAYKLTPKAGVFTETVVHAFAGNDDGAAPIAPLAEANDGTLFGTTPSGGDAANGIAFSIALVNSTYQENILYTFRGTIGGGVPLAGLTLGSGGVLFGTASVGGHHDFGTAFSLTPSGSGGYVERTLHDFDATKGGGSTPSGGLLLDASGDLYGTTLSGGLKGWGAVYELNPRGNSYAPKVLYSFDGGASGGSPAATPVEDAAGNLYGTSGRRQASANGNVFEIVR